MILTRARIKLGIIAIFALALLYFAVRDASMGGTEIFEGLLFTFGIYGIPFAVFAFVVWASRWPDTTTEAGALSLRNRIGLTAEIMALMSSSLLLSTLPCTRIIAEHETLGAFWIYSGLGTAVLGAVFSIAGSPRRWIHAVSCALLVPCWLFKAVLLAKMMMD
jgi:hypothetical protein